MLTLTISRSGALSRSSRICSLVSQNGRVKSGKTSLFRSLYQERLEILVNSLNYKSYPSLDEVRIYESKRYFAYWAKAYQLPHPKTWVYYHLNEALKAIESMKIPLVGKMNIGGCDLASGI